VDPSGSNIHYTYDVRMGSSPVGGISLVDCNGAGSKYVVKNNMSNKPVTFIKWLMAAKYINWLHNNKASSPINYIYSGAYNLTNIIEPLNINTQNNYHILSEDSKFVTTDQSFSILNHSELSSNISREESALYFLPNEDEWYKASYYDPTVQSYWKYGTKSNNDPYGVICNSVGSGQYIEGYHYSVKKFPILINKPVEAQSGPTLSQSDGCPTISISGSLAGSGLCLIESSITGLVYGAEYTYNFSSSFGNWPARITPLSGSFVAYSESQEINAMLQFCPKNYGNISQCNANIDYHSDTAKDIYSNIVLNVSTNTCSSIIKENYIVSVDELPVVTTTPGLNIEFVDSHENGIIVSGNLCCHPIPIVVSVSGHQPGDTYSYSLSSSSDQISLVPSSGSVSFGDQAGKITAYAIGLNNRPNNICVLSATVFKDNDIDVISSDQVLLQCIGDCEKSCDNHANFNNKAIWGDCGGSCAETSLPRMGGLVTTVGTNGGSGPYGTYDMDGNVYEIIAAGYQIRLDDYTPPTGWVLSPTPAVIGGSFLSNTVGQNSYISSTTSLREDVGFRIGSYSNPYHYPNMLPVNDIGSPLPSGNASDQSNATLSGFGKVKYPYMIAKYPVTNCEYAEFLNSVASTGVTFSDVNSVYSPLMSGCYGGINKITCGTTNAYYVQECMDHKPVRFLPTFAALRYTNWIENNKAPGWNSAISGTYSVNSSNAGVRKDCAKYFILSLDEWYKAAYYKGSNSGDTNAGYWKYSTKASISPEPVSASGCGHGYSGSDCDQMLIPVPCVPTQTPNVCTPTPTPTITVTRTPTVTPTRTPTATPTASATATPTPTPSSSYNFSPLFINEIP